MECVVVGCVKKAKALHRWSVMDGRCREAGQKSPQLLSEMLSTERGKGAVVAGSIQSCLASSYVEQGEKKRVDN